MPAEHLKPTILIVEDEEGPRNALKIVLRPFYNLALAANRHEALQALRAHSIDLVTLDLKLPDGCGLDLFHAIQRARRGVEIVIITGYGTLKSSQEAVQHGAAGCLLKPFNVADLITLINRTLEKKRRLDAIRDFLRSASDLWGDDRRIANTWAELRGRFPSSSPVPTGSLAPDPRDEAALTLIADLLEATDRMLLAHAHRVRRYAALLAEPLKLNQADQHALVLGAFLHDLGFVALERWAGAWPEPVTGTDGTDTRHPMLGVRMAAPLGVPEEALHAIAHHHERYDGGGYPDGLAGDQIPLLARIVGIAQTFDRLLIPDGRTAEPSSDACARLSAQAGTALDPRLVRVFLERISQPQQTSQTSARV